MHLEFKSAISEFGVWHFTSASLMGQDAAPALGRCDGYLGPVMTLTKMVRVGKWNCIHYRDWECPPYQVLRLGVAEVSDWLTFYWRSLESLLLDSLRSDMISIKFFRWGNNMFFCRKDTRCELKIHYALLTILYGLLRCCFVIIPGIP